MKKVLIPLVLIVVLALTGCGGGGSSTSVDVQTLRGFYVACSGLNTSTTVLYGFYLVWDPVDKASSYSISLNDSSQPILTVNSINAVLALDPVAGNSYTFHVKAQPSGTVRDITFQVAATSNFPNVIFTSTNNGFPVTFSWNSWTAGSASADVDGYRVIVLKADANADYLAEATGSLGTPVCIKDVAKVNNSLQIDTNDITNYSSSDYYRVWVFAYTLNKTTGFPEKAVCQYPKLYPRP